MARRGGPALYELLNSKRSGAVPAGGLAQPKLDPRALQSLLFVAVAVALIVIAFLLGVSRGERIGRLAAEAELAGGAPAGASAGGASVGGAQRLSGAQGQATPENQSASALAQSGASGAPAEPAGGADFSGTAAIDRGLGPMPAGDPRRDGLQYFVLCSTLEPNALKVVEFCRSKGLDAYVVPDQNGRLREVTVLPGFATGERSSPAIKELEESIRKVGVLFKASGPGNSDFGDRYIKTHRERQ
jgi:hypothetical protein